MVKKKRKVKSIKKGTKKGKYDATEIFWKFSNLLKLLNIQ